MLTHNIPYVYIQIYCHILLYTVIYLEKVYTRTYLNILFNILDNTYTSTYQYIILEKICTGILRYIAGYTGIYHSIVYYSIDGIFQYILGYTCKYHCVWFHIIPDVTVCSSELESEAQKGLLALATESQAATVTPCKNTKVQLVQSSVSESVPFQNYAPHLQLPPQISILLVSSSFSLWYTYLWKDMWFAHTPRQCFES
jgi:hypothetical protein